MPDDKRYDRRRFFREGLRELLGPLSRMVDPVQQAMRQLEALSETNEPRTAASQTSVWIRPPGAKFPDQDFRDACSRCGKCVEVCPAQCIKIDSTGNRGAGAPYIEPEIMPCVVCDGLQCMHVCPTGALAPIPLNDINMGTAIWNQHICVRGKGENCTICVDVCPLGSAAIELRGDRIHVIAAGCIGCGICQHRCPTEPKSIVVLSREVWEGKHA